MTLHDQEYNRCSRKCLDKLLKFNGFTGTQKGLAHQTLEFIQCNVQRLLAEAFLPCLAHRAFGDA
jgi:hypothetical protein